MQALKTLWQTDRLLTATGVMLALLAIPCAAAIWLDPRMITGAPAWLKPTKFALSTAIYSLTMAWVFSYLPDWPRTRRIVGRMTAAILILEIVIIDIQAWRGTSSHFNVSTPFDGTLFGVMGSAIALQTLTSVALAVALWRKRFADPATGWALRLGMTLTIIGAMTGGLMTRPTSLQVEALARTGTMSVVGAHTVGAPDGGPGLPGTGWSTAHGDLRVPHFVGLHALQALAIVVLLLRQLSAGTRLRLTLLAASVYTAVFAALLVQALRGIPFVALS